MNPKYNSIQWVVQSNLTALSDLAHLKNVCEKIGVTHVEAAIIPFTQELPAFDRSRKSIIYGSTTFNRLALKDKDLRTGVFFDERQFSIENYIDKWGAHMLNCGATITSFKHLIASGNYNSDKLLFIRPDDDSKLFAGEVKRFYEIKAWYDKFIVDDNIDLSSSKIVVSEPYNLQYEWRLWIVNKKVVAASKYRTYFNLTKEEGCPAQVASFAEERCKEFTPHDVFVMDICLCGDEYFIVECGCMNGAGFYSANIENIVSSVTEYFATIQ